MYSSSEKPIENEEFHREPVVRFFNGCPAPEEFQSERMVDFDAELYQGIWYEIAYHDIAQPSFCACTRLSWTMEEQETEGFSFRDVYTTNCFGPEGRLFSIPLRGRSLNSGQGGQFVEAGIADWVVDYGVDPESGEYEWAIKFKCLEGLGSILFTEVALLSRQPTLSVELLDEMLARLEELGGAAYGGAPEDLTFVDHEGCRYPTDDEAAGALPGRIMGVFGL
jgi:lipocalin